MVQTVFVSVDESAPAQHALKWAINQVLPPEGQLHIISVLPPASYAVTPTAPIATAGAVAAMSHTWEAQKKQDESAATTLLKQCSVVAQELGVAADHIHLHMLPATGGASGVAESVVEYANHKGADVLVLGSRGYGSFKRSMLALIGLGSVSDYCIHNVHTPVVVLRAPATEAANGSALAQGPRKICISLDDSEPSQYGLVWALDHLVRPGDQVHVVAVAQPVPFPIVDEASAAVAALESEHWHDQKQESMALAENTCKKGVAIAIRQGVPKESLFYKHLSPEGGASDVAESIRKYAEANGVDIVVVGSRGLGGVRRAALSVVGLGSVSDWCVHNMSCAVVVVKAKPHST